MTDKKYPELLIKLREIQRDKNLSDQEMVDRYLPGVSRPSYTTYFLNPDSLPCPEFYTAILRNFPHLKNNLVDFLKKGKNNKNKGG